MLNLDNLLIRLEEVYNLENRTLNNELMASYYETYASSGNNYEAKANRLRRCARNFRFVEHKRIFVYDLKKIYLCKDPFCINCQKFKSQNRLIKYAPTLRQAMKEHDLYHLVLTVPNCPEEAYDVTVNRMIKAYYTLNCYFTGHAKIKGYDFSPFGYAGSVRGFETTFNLEKRGEGQEYHPHIHAIFAMSKNFYPVKNTILDTYDKNPEGDKAGYSYSYKDVFKDGKKERVMTVRRFSEFEIVIQKIWYLLMNGKKVTAKAIKSLDRGYSCTCDRADDGSFLEVFKYAVKSFGDNNKPLDELQFKTLLEALPGRKMIQGYGIFRDIKNTEDIDQEVVMKSYDSIIMALNLIDPPEKDLVHFHLWQLKQEMLEGNKTFINRRAVLSLSDEDRWALDSKISKMLKTQKVNPEKFFAEVEQRLGNRRIGKELEAERKKKLQMEYAARAKARMQWVKVMLNDLTIARGSPLYASTVLSLKMEWNELHPREHKIADVKVNELPF